MKYTRDVLAAAAANSSSVADVLRHLGLKLAGGSHAHISRALKRFEIDTSHFTGSRSNCGAKHRGGPEKAPWTKVLVVRRPDQAREKAFRLRRAMIESGIEYVCGCGQGPVWRGTKLILHVEHKNGNFSDCRRENLEFMCPNCHSQRPTSGGAGLTGVTSIAEQLREKRKQRRALVVKLVDTQR